MRVLVSDTSVLVDLERGALLAASFRPPFRFTVPGLLYERETKDHSFQFFGHCVKDNHRFAHVKGGRIGRWRTRQPLLQTSPDFGWTGN